MQGLYAVALRRTARRRSGSFNLAGKLLQSAVDMGFAVRRESSQILPVDQRVYTVEASPRQVEQLRRRLGGSVWIEPEILHYPQASVRELEVEVISAADNTPLANATLTIRL